MIQAEQDYWIYPFGRQDGENGEGYHHHHPKYPSFEHQQQQTDSQPFVLDDDRRTMITGILIAIMVALSILLCYLVTPFVMEYLRAKIPESKARTERRYQTIEGWLVTKRARAHCNACDRLHSMTRRRPTTPQDVDASKNEIIDVDDSTSNDGSPKPVALSPSHDTAETEVVVDPELACCTSTVEDENKECPICMESFADGDVLSWSPSTCCQHVFHHECLKEWLLYHDNCPYCRVTVMPIDKLTADHQFGLRTTKTKQEQLLKLSRERLQRVRTTYYCIDHGLVVLPRPLSPTHSVLRRFMSTRVTTAGLASIRGTRSVQERDAPSTTSSEAETTGGCPREVLQPLRSQRLSV